MSFEEDILNYNALDVPTLGSGVPICPQVSLLSPFTSHTGLLSETLKTSRELHILMFSSWL
jgi:hypothetical protein